MYKLTCIMRLQVHGRIYQVDGYDQILERNKPFQAGDCTVCRTSGEEYSIVGDSVEMLWYLIHEICPLLEE